MTGLGCRAWTDGAFCQQCNVTDGSRYYSVASSTCKECTGSTANPIIAVVVLCLFVAGMVYVYSKFRPHERFAWFRMLRIRTVTMIHSISLRAKMKQCVGFYQVATNIREVYNIEMPSDTQSFLDSLKGVVNFDVTKTFGLPLECAQLGGYVRKLTFMMLWPIVTVAALIVGSIGRQWLHLLRKYRRSLKPPSEDESESTVTSAMTLDEVKAELPKRANRGLLMALPAVSNPTPTPTPTPTPHTSPNTNRNPSPSPSPQPLPLASTSPLTPTPNQALPAVSIITFLAFPAVSSIAFRAWACVEFDMVTKYDADNSPLPRAPPDVESFMRDDLRIQCGSPEHDDAASLVHI